VAAVENEPKESRPALAEDLIFGAEAIGVELGVTTRRAFHLLERHQIPAAKIGKIWTTSRKALRAHFDRNLNGG
jgi:hypothetical protein